MGPRDERRLIFGLFLFALAVRCMLWAGTYTFGGDSAAFLRMSELMADGKWDVALKTYYHPGYPALIGFFTMFTGDAARAGFLVSVLASSLAVIPLYLLSREFFGRPAAILAAIFYAVHSHIVDLHADVMTEGVYTALFVVSLWLGWKVMSTGKLWWAMLAGVTASGAYLVRNEGILVIVGLTCWFLFEAVRRRNRESRDLLLATPFLVGAFLIMSMPFLIWVRHEVGHWALTAKGSGVHFTKMVLEGGVMWSAGDSLTHRMLLYLVKLNFHVLLIPLAVGLASGWKGATRGRGYLLSFAVVYYLAVFYNIRVMGYTSIRYLVPGFCLLLPFMAAGLVFLFRKIPQPRLALVGCSVTVALVLVIGARNFGLNRWEFQSVRSAGEWIAKQGPPRPRIFSTVDKIGWYGHGDLVRWPETGMTLDHLAANAQFVMYTGDDLKGRPPVLVFLEGLTADPRFEEIKADFVQGRKYQRDVRLFKVVR